MLRFLLLLFNTDIRCKQYGDGSLHSNHITVGIISFYVSINKLLLFLNEQHFRIKSHVSVSCVPAVLTRSMGKKKTCFSDDMKWHLILFMK